MYENVAELYGKIHELTENGTIVSAYALDSKGVAAAVAKMAFGNKLGVKIDDEVTTDDLFDNGLGDILAEIPADKMAALEEKELDYTVIGTVTEEPVFVYGDVKITMEEALVSWTSKLEKVFPTKAVKGTEAVASNVYKADSSLWYVSTRSQSLPYSFRYSPEPTVNTTAPRHLNVPEPMWRQECSVT